MIILISGIPAGIRQGFLGDDGVCTTQLIFVFNGPARFFGKAPCGSFAGFVTFAVPATMTRSMDDGGLHRPFRRCGVRFKFYCFGCLLWADLGANYVSSGVNSSLELSLAVRDWGYVLSLSLSLTKLTHGEGEGSELERVREGPRLQSEMDGRFWRQSEILVDMSLDCAS